MSRKNIVLIVAVGMLAAGLLFAFLVAKGLHIDCPFYLLTGLQCPGCGNTRAALALLRLDLAAMLGYNLLFPLEMAYIVRVCAMTAKTYIEKGKVAYRPRHSWIDAAFLAALLVWWVVRNITPLY